MLKQDFSDLNLQEQLGKYTSNDPSKFGELSGVSETDFYGARFRPWEKQNQRAWEVFRELEGVDTIDNSIDVEEVSEEDAERIENYLEAGARALAIGYEPFYSEIKPSVSCGGEDHSAESLWSDSYCHVRKMNQRGKDVNFDTDECGDCGQENGMVYFLPFNVAFVKGYKVQKVRDPVSLPSDA